MAVATTLSLEDAIDVLEANLVDNGEATTLYCLCAVHISSGFHILLRSIENTPPGLAALLKMPQSDTTGWAGQSKLYRRFIQYSLGELCEDMRPSLTKIIRRDPVLF